jgi:uncharacterized protein
VILAARRSAWAGLVLALLCLSLPALAKAPDYPALTGRVVDQAGILGEPAEQQLTVWLQGFEQDTKRQVVVATVKSLDGQEIEEYANGLFRHWGLGQKKENTGALLLVAPNDRKVRIEVGYGLEGELTDAVSSAIINQQIIPRFRQGDFEGGIAVGTAEILRTLGWQGAPAAAQPPQGPPPSGGYEVSPFVFFGLIFVFFVFRALFGFGRRSRPGIWGTRSRGWGAGMGGLGGSGWGGGGWSSGGGFSGGGGSSGGGGASGSW